MVDVRLIAASAIAALIVSAAMAADDAALLAEARQVFQPLPKDMSTADEPVAKERVMLGRMLFFDPRLTADGHVSCATCHLPALYGTDARPTSIGVKQRPHPRNAPTILNAALAFVNHWRGDRKSLEDQAQQALNSPMTSSTDSATSVDMRRCSRRRSRKINTRSRSRPWLWRSPPMSEHWSRRRASMCTSPATSQRCRPPRAPVCKPSSRLDVRHATAASE